MPPDIRKWNITKLTELASDIRDRIIDTVGKRGGHLSPSLGVVELTIALHYVFDTPNDKLVWDVGHQSYAHKLITGRWQEFDTLRTCGGIAGFPKRKESVYDVFDTGHSGNSISVALGLATASKLKKENLKVIAVIGDGSIVTGMAFEALNYAGAAHENLIVILNDNEMSIGKSTGAMAKYLNRIITGRMYNRLKADTWNLLGLLPKNLIKRTRLVAKKIEEGLKSLIAPSIIFEELGFRYLGPFDGHNLEILIENFHKIKNIKGPILVHVVTKKGKGYEPAEKEPEIYHGIGPFATEIKCQSTSCEPNAGLASTSDVFGKTLIDLAEKDNRVCAISAGMCLGTGLIEFKKKFPERFFDVGICEQHAVTFAGGLALQGLRPIVAIYSTFLARAYDQIIQDVALQNLPVIFAIDRAGIVGEDGPTHHGNFDISYLRAIPNLVISAPKDSEELTDMLNLALKYNGPFTIRYPKGCFEPIHHTQNPEFQIGEAEIIFESGKQKTKNGKRVIVLAIGSMVSNSYNALLKIAEKESTMRDNEFVLVNMRFVKPLDENLLLKLVKPDDIIITVEENILSGGFGSAIMELFQRISNIQHPISNIISVGLEDIFIEQGKREELLDYYGLSPLKLKEKFIKTVQQLKD
jgi:1-deoxy-D-xylulose-5-phosphate synthase